MSNEIETIDAIFAAAKSWGSKERKGEVARAVLVDQLISSGTLPGFHTKVDNAEGKKVYSATAAAVREGVICGWGAGAVKLMNTPTKDLPAQSKFEKDRLNKGLGSRMKKLSATIEARKNPVEKGPTTRKDDAIAIPEIFANLVKRVQTSEGAGDIDLVAVSEWLAKSPLK